MKQISTEKMIVINGFKLILGLVFIVDSASACLGGFGSADLRINSDQPFFDATGKLDISADGQNISLPDVNIFYDKGEAAWCYHEPADKDKSKVECPNIMRFKFKRGNNGSQLGDVVISGKHLTINNMHNETIELEFVDNQFVKGTVKDGSGNAVPLEFIDGIGTNKSNSGLLIAQEEQPNTLTRILDGQTIVAASGKTKLSFSKDCGRNTVTETTSSPDANNHTWDALPATFQDAIIETYGDGAVN